MFAICMLLSVFSYADDKPEENNKDRKDNKNGFVVGGYIGGSIMSASSNYYTSTNQNSELPGDYDRQLFGGSYGAKVGYDMFFLPQHGLRLYLDYTYSYYAGDSYLGSYNQHTIGINADYRFVIFDNFIAFAGLGLAHNIITNQYIAKPNALNAFGASLNMGLSYAIGFFEFEFKIRYLMYNIPDKSSTNLSPPLHINGNQGNTIALHFVELEPPISFLLGVNVKF